MITREEHPTMALESAATNPDIQEALSRRYSDSVVVILRLKSGRYAIFDNLRALCGVVDSLEEQWPPECWRAPPPPSQQVTKSPKTKYEVERLPRKPAQPPINLKELGLS
jgi:hypothetical protein